MATGWTISSFWTECCTVWRTKGASGVSCGRSAAVASPALQTGERDFDRGEYAGAIEVYQRAWGCAYNAERQIKSLALIGKCLMFKRDGEAQQYFSRAYDLARAAQDEITMSFVLEQEAHAAGFVEDYKTARRVAAEQVALNERFLQAEPDREMQRTLFYSLNNLGMAELRLGQTSLAEVIAIHHRAEQIALQLNSPELKAHVFWSLAEGYHKLADRAQAARYLDEAYRLYKVQNKSRDEQVVVTFIREHGYAQEVLDS